MEEIPKETVIKETSINTIKDNKKEQIKTEIDYDDLVSAAGDFGLYHVFISLATCPFYVFGSFAYFAQLFMTEVSPNHWCWVPELENLTDIERRSLAIPQDANSRFGYSFCTEYVANWSAVLDSGQKPDVSWPTQQCRYGWEYNATEIPYPTIGSEWNWVCDKNSYQATAQAAFFIGCVVGGFFIGWLADRYGRIPAGIFSNVIGCIAGVASVFSRNFVEFTVCRFIMGMSYDNCMTLIFLVILESTSPKYRTLIANLSTGTFFTLGLTVLPWIAKACGHWKIIGAVCSIPMALTALLLFIIPESPRFLLSKGRTDEAIQKIVKIGKINKKVVPEELIQQFKLTVSCSKEENKESNLLEILKRPLLRWVLFCICTTYMCSSIVFDALVRNLDALAFDFFLSFTLVSITELPAFLIVSFVLDKMGRKFLSVIVMTICCVFSILAAFVKIGVSSLICAIIARFGVNVSLMVAAQWATELLPTPVRGAGASLVHICGFLATVVAPYVAYTENYVAGLPLIIVGILSAISTFFVIFLPETTNKVMPQTFEEAEDLVRNKKIIELPFIKKD